TLVEKVVAMFGAALANRQPAEIGFGRGIEAEVAYNRRMVMCDGTVKTQATTDDPDALYLEGPIDPEVAVLAARKIPTLAQSGLPTPSPSLKGGEQDRADTPSPLGEGWGGEIIGALVNFACHPTHHGSDGVLSAGFPGALAAEMRARGCPVT